MKDENNYAFIDSQNLNLSIRELDWILDFARFRVYLKEKYIVNKAFLFIGFVESNKKLYNFLSRAGYVCIFKPTLKYKNGETKGNCDAELIPNKLKFSALLKFRQLRSFLRYMNDLRQKLEYKKKRPYKDKTL